MKFLFAGSLRDADSTALIDLKWTKRADAKWIDRKGREVIYLASVDQLQGIPHGAIIVLGYGWQRRNDADRMLQVARARGCKTIDARAYVSE